jgi:hypothetical protein
VSSTRRTVFLFVVSLAALCAACQGGGGSSGTQSAARSDLANRYGYGPQPDPSVTYQPDVVLIAGGPTAIRGVSRDGLTWSMDAHAPGVDQLSPGRIMFASSVAVGRVLKREPEGGIVEVMLAPVSLGEVVRDAHLVLDRTVSLDSLAFAEIPQIPNGYEDIRSNQLTSASRAAYFDEPTLRAPTVILAGTPPAASPAGNIPVGATEVSEKSTAVGGWTLTAYRTSAQGGAVNGLSDNRKVKIEIPIELRQPVIIGGFPAMLTQKFKFLVHTAFTAKNGSLSAFGAWDVDGSIGMDGQTVSVPTMTPRGDTKLIDNLAGISIGVNGMVVAVSFEFGLMIGMPVAGAGPVASFITSLGLTNGSGIGLLRGSLTCKQVSITSVVSAGVAVQVFDPVKKALKSLLGYELPAQQTILTRDILQERWVKPNVVACR